MSSPRASPTSLPTEQDFVEALHQPDKLNGLVEKILMLQKDDVSELIGNTSKTAFRKIHEHLASAIDEALELIDRSGNTSEGLGTLTLLFTRGLILLSYQEARQQLSRELAARIKAIISQVLQLLRSGSLHNAKYEIESMRVLLDALMVLVYKYARR